MVSSDPEVTYGDGERGSIKRLGRMLQLEDANESDDHLHLSSVTKFGIGVTLFPSDRQSCLQHAKQ